MIKKKIWNKEYKLIIQNDVDAENPRYYSNIWTFIMQHKWYNMWDIEFENHWNSFEEDFAYHIAYEYNFEWNDYSSDYGLTDKELKTINKWIDENIIYEKVYMYDHSWVAISTTPFHCSYDSWQIWYIYALKSKAEKEFINNEWKNLEDKLREVLKWEIEILNKYLQWDMYEFKIFSRDTLEKDWKKFHTNWEFLSWTSWLYADSLEELAELIYYDCDIFTQDEIQSYNISI